MKVKHSRQLLLFAALFILALAVEKETVKKNRVLLIGMDGLLSKCLNETIHSALDQMMEKGSYTFDLRTTIEAVSAPGWSTILCGMETEDSSVTSNDWYAPWVYSRATPLMPITGYDKPLPCIFEHVKKHMPPTIKIVSVHSWEWLINLGKFGIPNSIDEEYLCIAWDLPTYVECDKKTVKKSLEVIDSDFDFLFVYFSSQDESGHTDGWCSKEYIEMISTLDSMVLQLFAKLKEKNIFDETTIVYTVDHGGSYGTKSHGYQNNDNVIVPLLVMGPGIKKGYQLQGKYKNADVSPTISKIFGIEPNPIWRGRAIDEIFEEKKEQELLVESFLK